MDAPEQLSIWDITETSKKVTEKSESFIKTVEKVPKITDSFSILEKYKTTENLSRIIGYCGGGYGIELNTTEGIKTIYLNREGEKEFTKDKRLPVLPMDKILYYKEDLHPNSLQQEKLKEIKPKYKAPKIIKRKGDQNILVEVPGKVISINSKGWVLEFKGIDAKYEENEVIKDNVVEDLHCMQQKVKVGDFVQALYGKEVIEGKIIREYGLSNAILNIIFDNGKKHTAIGRRHVLKILNV